MRTCFFLFSVLLSFSLKTAADVDFKLCDWDATKFFPNGGYHDPIVLTANKDGFLFKDYKWRNGVVRSDIKDANGSVIGTELKFLPGSSPADTVIMLRLFKGQNSEGLVGGAQALYYSEQENRWTGSSYTFNYQKKSDGSLRCIPVHGDHLDVTTVNMKSVVYKGTVFDLRPCNRLRALYAKIPSLEKCGFEVAANMTQEQLDKLDYVALRRTPIAQNWWAYVSETYKSDQANVRLRTMCLSKKMASAVQSAVGKGYGGDMSLNPREPKMPLTTQAFRFLTLACRPARFGTAVDETYELKLPPGPWVPGKVF